MEACRSRDTLSRMSQRMALYFQDKHPIGYEIEMARYAEERGFSEIWQRRHPFGPRLRGDDERPAGVD